MYQRSWRLAESLSCIRCNSYCYWPWCPWRTHGTSTYGRRVHILCQYSSPSKPCTDLDLHRRPCWANLAVDVLACPLVVEKAWCWPVLVVLLGWMVGLPMEPVNNILMVVAFLQDSEQGQNSRTTLAAAATLQIVDFCNLASLYSLSISRGSALVGLCPRWSPWHLYNRNPFRCIHWQTSPPIQRRTRVPRFLSLRSSCCPFWIAVPESCASRPHALV